MKRYDRSREAILLERLGPQLHQLNRSVDAQIQIICTTLNAAWMPVPPDCCLVSGAEKAQALVELSDRLWEELGRPCHEITIKMVRRFGQMRIRAFDATQAVINHGDAHAWNTLAASPSDPSHFKFIDPDPVAAERAYDLGVLMREWNTELLAGDPLTLGRRRCTQIATLTGLDAESIWQWGFLQRVSNGLLCLKNRALEMEGRKALLIADAWTQVLSDG